MCEQVDLSLVTSLFFPPLCLSYSDVLGVVLSYYNLFYFYHYLLEACLLMRDRKVALDGRGGTRCELEELGVAEIVIRI